MSHLDSAWFGSKQQCQKCEKCENQTDQELDFNSKRAMIALAADDWRQLTKIEQDTATENAEEYFQLLKPLSAASRRRLALPLGTIVQGFEELGIRGDERRDWIHRYVRVSRLVRGIVRQDLVQKLEPPYTLHENQVNFVDAKRDYSKQDLRIEIEEETDAYRELLEQLGDEQRREFDDALTELVYVGDALTLTPLEIAELVNLASEFIWANQRAERRRQQKIQALECLGAFHSSAMS